MCIHPASPEDLGKAADCLEAFFSWIKAEQASQPGRAILSPAVKVEAQRLIEALRAGAQE
ncbi:MAG: hypothetical protein GXC94_02015 [Comamonadaceae bacterium]|jgi:hypothetical protein|nr:hypothetical protein [Comamonadaceae bacterium]